MRQNRLEYNLKILKELEKFFNDNPHIRFFQGLWNVDIVEWYNNNDSCIKQIRDKFSEESEKTFNKLLNKIDND